MRRLGSSLVDPNVLIVQWDCHRKAGEPHSDPSLLPAPEPKALEKTTINRRLGPLTPMHKTPVTLSGAPIAWGDNTVPLYLFISHLLQKHHPHSILSQREGSGGKWFQLPSLDNPFLQNWFLSHQAKLFSTQ